MSNVSFIWIKTDTYDVSVINLVSGILIYLKLSNQGSFKCYH